MKKLLAFTLAETLIVIGIIGVVSALTLPNLNSSTGEKEKVAKVKKIYQNLDDAVGRAVATYGPIEEWFANDTTEEAKVTRFADRITEFMKISKKIDDARYILADGTLIWVFSHIDSANGTCDRAASYPEKNLCYSIYVDIDGPNKGKNTAGYDQFNFLAIESGVLPDDTSAHHNVGNKAAYTNDGVYYAAAWVIMNENMDYLKCFNELNWTNKTSCK